MRKFERKNNKISGYTFYVDMSGQPSGDDLYIGCIFINDSYVGQFLNEFYKAFPYLRRFNKKSTTLSPEKIKEVINYINDKKIRMICLKFHKHKLNKYYREISETKNKFNYGRKIKLYKFKEKIIGTLYFYLIKHLAWKRWHYGFECCIESHLRILDVLHALNKLSRRDGYVIHSRYNHRRNQHMLKFADFIAGAGRKLDDSVLKNFKYLIYELPEIEEYDSNNLFGIND